MKVLVLAAAVAAASPAVPVLPAAEVVTRMPAQATQGVAVDGAHVYGVSNSRIVKYDKKTGVEVARWEGDRVQFPHINSCTAIAGELVCANSNFPQVPQWSSIEVFDPKTLRHLRSVPLGMGIGSLTWVERKDGAWWATFANYDVSGAEPGRDHRHTQLVKFDDQWRRTQAWTFPKSVLDRFTPMSSSGGGWGGDGLLYITGHDHPELYVLRLPKAGAVLEHVATIPVQVEGQAVDWDESQDRVLYGISRPSRAIVAMKIPSIGALAD